MHIKWLLICNWKYTFPVIDKVCDIISIDYLHGIDVQPCQCTIMSDVGMYILIASIEVCKCYFTQRKYD